MSNETTTKYFDLMTSGLGYLGRIREVTPRDGKPFLVVKLAALRGSADDARYTHIECRVAGRKAHEVLRQVRPAVDGDLKVLVGFTLSNLSAEAFTFKHGERAGEPGVALKARLLRLSWVKVDGEPFYSEDEHAA